VLVDGGAPEVLASAPASVVLADGGAPAVLAFAPLSVVLVDGGAPAVLTFAPASVVLTDGGAPAVLACQSGCATTLTAASLSTSVQGRRLLLQELPGARNITPCLCTEQASCPRDRSCLTSRA
jgi:hypothetical protein